MFPMPTDENRSAGGLRSPLGERLRALPEFEPPAGGWERLEQRRRGPQRRWRQFAGGGLALAASILLAVTLMIEGPSPSSPGPTLVASHTAPASQPEAMPQLIKVSQQLEQRLGQLRPRVALWDSQRAQQARELQRALELIDLQLNYADPATADRLWRERIALMSALVELHQQPSTRFHHASYQY